MDVPPLHERFVIHFGEMGARWGVNRTVGQIYALLFLSDRPLCADDIVASLGFSRSNVSMGLKELQAWGLVRLRHLPGDRRDHFTTPDDIWEIVRTLAEQRKAREIDPTLSLLRELAMEKASKPEEVFAQQRMADTAEIIELLTGWYDEVKALETSRLKQLLALGAAVQRVLEWRDALRLAPRKAATDAQPTDAQSADVQPMGGDGAEQTNSKNGGDA